MKTQTFFIVFGVFLLLVGVGIGLYLYFTRDGNPGPAEKGEEAQEQQANDSPVAHNAPPATASATTNNSISNVVSDWNKVLKKGSTGEEVKLLQGLINESITKAKQRNAASLQYPNLLTKDGNFGAQTETALRFCIGKDTVTLNSFYGEMQKHIQNGSTVRNSSVQNSLENMLPTYWDNPSYWYVAWQRL